MNQVVWAETANLGDDEVVARVRGGELQLFELVMRRYNQRLFRVARAIVRDDAEAEDVMQEAYVRAYAHLAEFEGRASFATWLTRIAVHEALARARRRVRYDRLDDERTDDEEVNDMRRSATRDPEEQASLQELRGEIERAVDALPDTFREVFVLRAVEGLSVSETAQCLDIPEDTVKTRLHRARGQLKRALLDRVDAATPAAFDFHLRRCDRIVAAVFARISRITTTQN